MTRMVRRWSATVALGAIVALAACERSAPLQPDATSPEFSHLKPGQEVCEVVGFDGFEHGEAINSLSAFHTSLTVTTAGNDPYSEDQARAYDTDNVGGPDFDLEWDGADARCEDCEGLGNVLVIGDNRGFADEGDSPSGGTVTITGFPSEGETYVDRFVGVDHEDTENAIELWVDGTKIGQTTALGDGSVQTLDVTATSIESEVAFVFGGSGAVDDLRICHTPPEGGDEGCTPGYWKQPQHFDSWPTDWTDSEGYPSADFCSSDGSGAVFTCSTMIELRNPESGYLNDITLLEALKLRGGGVNALARHAAAAALNGATSVDYAYTLSMVQSMVDEALGSGEYRSLKRDLEEANEEYCPLD